MSKKQISPLKKGEISMVNVDKWPVNLLCGIYFEIEGEKFEEYQDSFENDIRDIRATLYYALNTLPERTCDILLLYFRDNMTLKAISEKFNISRERARQIRTKGCRELREKYSFEELLLGMREFYSKKITLEKKISFDMGSNKTVAKIINEGLRKTMDELKEKTNAIYQIPFSSLFEENKISVRLYNCLLRANIKTLGDAAEKTPEQIKKIRNLGTKAYDDLMIILHNYGIELAQEQGKDLV